MSGSALKLREMPLVGRADLVDHLVRELVGSGSAFVLAGSAGVGKSRLAAEVARGAAGRGLTTSHVAATRAAASIPFGAFAPLMPDIAQPPGGLLSVLRWASDAIVDRAGRAHRLLVVVDDAHLLDDGSAALVHQLVHESSCRVVATIRSPGPAPDPITALWKDDLAERLDIEPLSVADVRQLVSATLGGPMTGAGTRWLWDTSGGNPLYVRELLAGALESGSLRDEGGVWQLRLPLPAPRRLAELVASRLAGLPAHTADVVDLVALGEPLPVDVLTAIVPPGALEDAEERGVIKVSVEAGVASARMDHPIYGEVRRHEIPPIRMRRLCTELARAMERRPEPRQGDELRIARWQVEAGLPGDPSLLGRAAMAARRVFDLDLATRLAKASLDAGGGIEAGLALAEADFFSGRPEQAETVLAGLVPQCSGDDEISRVANARAYNLGVMLGDRDTAMDVIESALAAVTEPMARYRLLNRRATTDLYGDRPRAALADAEELLASGDDTTIARGAYVAAFALASLGKADDAVRTATIGVDAFRRSGDTSRLPEAYLISVVTAHLGAGRLDEAAAAASRGYEANALVQSEEGIATFAMLRGWLHVEQGSPGEAARLFREGAAVNRDLKDVSALRWCIGGTALACGMAGDAGGAAAAVAELDTIPPHWMDALDSDLVLRGRAWAAAAGGELTTAEKLLRESAATARRREQPYAEARLLHDLARLGAPAEAAARLHDLAASVDGALVPAFAAHAAALVAGDAAGLERAAGTFEDLGALGLAAETYRSASLAYAGEGLARASNAHARKAAELAERCGGAVAPGVTGGREASRLTRREREIAALAASGLSSREIGERLFISARTVENHLASTYLKLGVSAREELAGALKGS